MDPYLPRDRERRPGGRVPLGTDGGRTRGVFRRPGAWEKLEPCRLGSACAGLDTGQRPRPFTTTRRSEVAKVYMARPGAARAAERAPASVRGAISMDRIC